ncbi:daptide-type RiPP biosynthesis aminotransferase [Streptomyces sp. NPDC093707]|uniref:daptide-type RiPP biosynthesis aminotransferase n=1 Tax=Streptomyces sp. NPDC093707 TaxID=3154984 RepID=UPI00344E07EF
MSLMSASAQHAGGVRGDAAAIERYPLWEALAAPRVSEVPARTAVSAQGVHVGYADGSRALCATSGLWNVNLGYGNHAVAKAVSDALLHVSYLSLFRNVHEPAVTAARALVQVSGADHFGRVLFSTSGGAANDLTMKVARHYWALRGEEQRKVIVGLKGSYHGLTYGSHGLTGEQLGQPLYGVDRRYIRHVAHHDGGAELAALLRREGHRVAAVVVEPVLGSGVFPLTDSFLATLQALRREHGFLLVADEVATGFGRTGRFFASECWQPRPDLLITSKGLTNGTCAAAALVVAHHVCDVFEHAGAVLVHGETQAGTPPTCAAVVSTIAEMERLGALERARTVSAGLDMLLSRLQGHPLVVGTRGVGCFRALELAQEGAALSPDAVTTAVAAIREAGVVVQPGPSCIQLVPALVYEDADLQELEAALATGLDRLAEALA